MQTKVKKWGNNLGLRIPIKFGYNLQELLSKITSENIHEAIDTGAEIGKEVW